MNKKSGFTLIEILVSVVIFGIIMLFGLSFFSYGFKPQARAKEIAYALTLAQSGIEFARAKYYNASKYSTMPGTIENSVIFVNPNNNMQFSRTISTTSQTYGKKILVTVVWPSGTAAHKVELATLISQPYN